MRLLDLASILILLSAPIPAWAASSTTAVSADDQARFLAGLPLRGDSPLKAVAEGAIGKTHAAELGAAWQKLDENRLSTMGPWAKAEIAGRIKATLPVVYLFGGPDAISVDVIYPDAPLYVLCGLEPLGNLPAIEALPEPELERGLANLRTALRTTIDLSFFVTTKMNRELGKTQIRGVLPILYLFLARGGERVLGTETIYLDPRGKVQTAASERKIPPSGVPGWRIRIQRGDGPLRELQYFKLDLSNDKLHEHPGLFPYLSSLGPANSFLKAASFILHDTHFNVTRKHLLAHSASILQDDSGIPFHFFKETEWERVMFGEYTPEKRVFRDHFQPDMKKDWDAATPRPLPFSTGYRHDEGSNLLLALPKLAAK